MGIRDARNKEDYGSERILEWEDLRIKWMYSVKY